MSEEHENEEAGQDESADGTPSEEGRATADDVAKELKDQEAKIEEGEE